MQSKQEGNCYKLHAVHFHGSVDFKNTRQTIKLMSWLDRRDIGRSQEVGGRGRRRRDSTIYDNDKNG